MFLLLKVVIILYYIVVIIIIESSLFLRTVSIIQTTPVEKQIERAILEGLKRLEMSVNEKNVCNLYAVRSSAVGEDSEETSAAGQNSTYLGVKNANDIINCVAKCWASLFSYQSVEYR